MRLFLSYPSVQRPLAERLALALEGEGHDVFMDRTDLKAGETFHGTLRVAIERADAFVFLVTPEAVAPGSYCLAEMGMAQQKWRRPGGRVLPVMVVPTPIAALPAYLAAVTVLAPRGELVAEVVAAVAQMDSGAGRRRLVIRLAVGAAVLAAAGAAVWWQDARRVEQQAAAALAQAASATQLCNEGGHEAALAQLGAAAALPAAPAAVRTAREDCAMRWLRGMRATVGRRSFSDQAAVTEPVLLQGLVQASASRAADLRAHVGWGEYLRGRDGATVTDPLPHWRRALSDDPANPYAHAMWARKLLDSPRDVAGAVAHFTQALATGRDVAFVRALQLGGSIGGDDRLVLYGVGVADQMRRAGEPVEPAARTRLWSYGFGTRLLDADWRAALATALPARELLATFDALFPAAEVREDQRMLWRFDRLALQAASGEAAEAYAGFAALVTELRAARMEGRIYEESKRALERLAPDAAPKR